MMGHDRQMFTQLFTAKRKEVKKEQKKCLHQYEDSIEELISKNPKSFFAYTKAQKQSNNVPTSLFYGNKIAENMKESSEMFAQYLSSVYVNHNNDFQVENTDNAHNYFEIDANDIEKVVLSMDEKKTNSPDGIPTIFYKKNH